MAIEYPNTWVELCNLAIARLGKPPISSLTEGTPAAGYCNTYLGEIIEKICDQSDWNGLAKRVALARLSTAPSFGFDYQYQLPSDYVRPIKIYLDADEPDMQDYTIEGDVLLTDAEEVSLVYVALPADPAKIPSYLKLLLVAALAVRLTTPLISSEAIIQRMASDYNDAVVLARRSDARRNREMTPRLEYGHDFSEELR